MQRKFNVSKNFVDDFERSEHSDLIQAAIGRCLIVATRFDSMCIQVSRTMLIEEVAYKNREWDNTIFERFVTDVCKYVLNLNDTIKEFRFSNDTYPNGKRRKKIVNEKLIKN